MPAFLFDVDNTLTNTHREITPRTSAALHALSEKNVILGVCTGRSYAELCGWVLPLFPSEALHIVSGGAQVISSQGSVMWEKKIPSETVQSLIEEVLLVGGNFVFGQGDTVFATPSEQDRKSQLDWKMKFAFPSDLKDWSTCLLSFSSIPDDFMRKLSLRSDILVKTMVRSSGELYCDITPAGVTKATGLHVWSNIQHCSLSEITGFGDSENDLEFLQAVGKSVALGNAVPVIKGLADVVIGHTNDEGLAVYLEALA